MQNLCYSSINILFLQCYSSGTAKLFFFRLSHDAAQMTKFPFFNSEALGQPFSIYGISCFTLLSSFLSSLKPLFLLYTHRETYKQRFCTVTYIHDNNCLGGESLAAKLMSWCLITTFRVNSAFPFSSDQTKAIRIRVFSWLLNEIFRINSRAIFSFSVWYWREGFFDSIR